jgi:hypothetical protein
MVLKMSKLYREVQGPDGSRSVLCTLRRGQADVSGAAIEGTVLQRRMSLES